MRRYTIALLFVLCISALAVAQDYTGQERIRISSPGVFADWPRAAVNDKGEIGTFFMWFGGSGAPDGIAFRKLDNEGMPKGPQKFAYKTNPSETRGFNLYDAVFADGHYFLLVYNSVQHSIVLFRFTDNGTFVNKVRYKFGEREGLFFSRPRLIIAGDDIYISLSTSEGYFMIVSEIPRDGLGSRQTENYFLKTNVNSLAKFEKIEFLPPTNDYTFALGTSMDPDHIVVLMGTIRPYSEPEIVNVGIVSINLVTGEIGKFTPIDVPDEIGAHIFGIGGSAPVYNGKGHLFYYNSVFAESELFTFSYDSEGKTVFGPLDIGQRGTFHIPYDGSIVGSFAFMSDFFIYMEAVGSMVIGPKGKHVKNIFYEENREYSFRVGSLGQVFTGNHIVFYYLGFNGYFIGPSTQGIFIYSKAIPTPKPIKDGIAFFQAGSQNFEDGSRHLLWSVVGSESVIIKHDGQEYYPLPAQYSFKLPNANSKKPVELTFTSAAGKTYTRKIKLK
jgi:hypothetical protein